MFRGPRTLKRTQGEGSTNECVEGSTNERVKGMPNVREGFTNMRGGGTTCMKRELQTCEVKE